MRPQPHKPSSHAAVYSAAAWFFLCFLHKKSAFRQKNRKGYAASILFLSPKYGMVFSVSCNT